VTGDAIPGAPWERPWERRHLAGLRATATPTCARGDSPPFAIQRRRDAVAPGLDISQKRMFVKRHSRHVLESSVFGPAINRAVVILPSRTSYIATNSSLPVPSGNVRVTSS